MAISFGGLATGLDTNTLVTQLLQMEKRPLARLEADKAWNSNRLAAFGQFNGKLQSLLQKIEDIDTAAELQSKTAKLSAEGFFKATAGTDAVPGSYQVEVVSLAQVEKEVSQGYTDKSAKSFGTGTISLSVGASDPVEITIDAENNSLEGMMKAINDADAGVTASIINDGTSSPYRLVLTAKEVAKAVTLDVSGLAGGTYANPTFVETQTGKKAHVRVDGIDIYGTATTIKDAIPGVTLELTKAEEGIKTSFSIATDEAAIKKKIQSFVTGYNDVVSFVTKQSVIDGSSGGILKGDAGLNSIKRRLQDMLVTAVDGGGSLKTLSQLGIQSQKDGTLKLDDAVLTKAIQENLGDVAGLLAGGEGKAGIVSGFKDYLKSVTHTTDGLYAGRKTSIDSNIKRINKSIEQTNARLEQREKALRSQFNALEKLVSAMNSQSAYVAQQMTMLNNMWSRD